MKPTAGIDVGSLTAECAIIDHKEGALLASARAAVLPNPVDSARLVFDRALTEAGLTARDLGRVIATGYGREKICEDGLANDQVSEISCHGFGAFSSDERIRTIIDIGGQDAKAIRVDDQGNLVDFVMNDKCAAGTGHFLELMSRTLEVSLDELGPISLSSRNPISMSSRCSIFVETEVVHFLQRGISVVDIAAGINLALAERVASLVRRIKPTTEVALTGGVAKNVAVRRALERRLNLRLSELPIDSQLVGAYGAAQLARKEAA